MHQNESKDLIARLAGQFNLAAKHDPETLLALLPLLNKLHQQFIKAALPENARLVLQIRDSVESCIRSPGDEQWFHNIGADIEILKGAEIGKYPPACEIDASLNDLERVIAGFCPQSSAGRNDILLAMHKIEAAVKTCADKSLCDIVLACKTYTEGITLDSPDQIRPIEETLLLLKSIRAHMKRGEAFTFDYSDVLELLDDRYRTGGTQEQTEGSVSEDSGPGPEDPQPLPMQDLEILSDFVLEALDNLEAVEIRLVDLEAEPSNTDIINEIFRPIHTIKGVSGFLSLEKINTLSHAAENLLDNARNGGLIITAEVIDAILASVDVLKQIIDRVDQGVRKGRRLPDDDIDIHSVQTRLQNIQTPRTLVQPRPLGEILIKNKAIDRLGLDQALAIQRHQPDRKLGEILVAENKVTPQKVASALMAQERARPHTQGQVKVDTQKLDDLVDYAGELVIAQSILKQKTGNDPDLTQSISQLGLIVTKMQNISMSMRMIPIKATFMKMIRLVRDLSRKTGKPVMLNMSGEDTEIDRNVVDALYEPMVHMIRNAVDHGLESAKERSATGKSVQGRIDLRAYHKGGSIIIEIEDDGRGLNREKILEKAVSKGMIARADQMSDAQVFDLIMQPGFSTAAQVTDVSGRGVGMDVVKEGIQKFRGHLTISSQPSKGTKFTISLPLTLAIIDGMLVRSDQEKYVIPTTAIQRVFKPGKDEYFTVESKGELVKDRGNLLPLIRLKNLFGGQTENRDIHKALIVVVESKDKQRALVIDELLGKDEYVIKSLGGTLEGIKGIAGGAILGNGSVGLILDIHGICNTAA